jgi:hypothetical protein
MLLSKGDPMDMIYARDYCYIGTLTLANELCLIIRLLLSNDSIFYYKGCKIVKLLVYSSFGERPIEDLEQWKELINRNDPVKIIANAIITPMVFP